MIDITFKLGPSTNPITNIQLSYRFVNNNTRLQLIKISFPCFSQYLKYPSRYVYKPHKHLDFDGQMGTHRFKCLQTMYFTCKQQQFIPIIHYKGEILLLIIGYP